MEEGGEREGECWEELEERLPPSGASEAGVSVSARMVRDTVTEGGRWRLRGEIERDERRIKEGR